jgi:3-deoxy-D-manno-octulosonic-acid transferase
MRLLYTALLYLLTPFVLLRLFWRGFSLPAYWHRIPERFGFVPPIPGGVAVWVHAVSVGESIAALPLIKALIERHGQGKVWVTTTTPTGSARVVEALGAAVRHSYAPYDLPGPVERFLRRAQPLQVIVMETELWPNLFHALAARKLPLTVANARLSPRSFAGYSRVRGFAARTLANCSVIAAQSSADAERFRALGATRVSVMGNIKFDLSVPASQVEAGRDLRVKLGQDRPVWVAASTHPGEEEQVLSAHRKLLELLPAALLILVPRHPQRFEAAARQIEASGLAFTRRSAPWPPTSDPSLPTPVLLGDSMGEMFMYFAAADVAYVGGSLVPVGGHNVLEPAALGLPVLFGPHMFNFAHARELLLGARAALEVADAHELQSALAALLKAPERSREMGRAGASAVEANRGALARLLELLAHP